MAGGDKSNLSPVWGREGRKRDTRGAAEKKDRKTCPRFSVWWRRGRLSRGTRNAAAKNLSPVLGATGRERITRRRGEEKARALCGFRSRLGRRSRNGREGARGRRGASRPALAGRRRGGAARGGVLGGDDVLCGVHVARACGVCVRGSRSENHYAPEAVIQKRIGRFNSPAGRSDPVQGRPNLQRSKCSPGDALRTMRDFASRGFAKPLHQK